jgi:signal transduction histidine kinase
MKLIYQQMIGFLSLIVVALTVVSLMFISITTNNAWETNSRQLANYTETLEQNAVLSDMTINTAFLANNERLLSGQHVQFMIYNSNNQQRYPFQTSAGTISKQYWKRLKQGESISIRGTATILRRGGTSRTVNASIYYRPVFYSGKLLYVIEALEPVETIQSAINKTQKSIFIAFVISALAAIVVSYFIARRQVERINRLRNATHEIAQGNYDVTLDRQGRDEISELASDFGDMTDALQASEKEIERQEDRRRQFMADAAHEMRTPLTTINGLLEGLAYDAIPEEMKAQSIDLMRNETNRLIRLVNENLDYEKIRTGQIILKKTTFDSKQVLENIANQLEKKADDAGDKIIVNAPDDLTAYADYDRFVQVIFNIMQNAIQFTQNGTITVTGRHGFHQSEYIISDTGIGMTEDQLKNIWERYYKADPSRKNTKYGESGLGLAIVHQLVAQHGGTIKVDSEIDHGTTFTLTFPTA